MSQELYYHLLQGFRSRITAYVCTAAAIGLVAAVPTYKTEASKTLSLSGALALSLAATANFRSNQENDSALNDFRINTGLQRQRNLFALGTAAIVAEESSEESLQMFNFSDIGDNRDQYAHFIIMGESGSGKTTIAEYLGCILRADKRYAIHPHAKDKGKEKDFAGFDGLYGAARNFGSPDDAKVSWTAIVNREVEPTIAQVLMALLELMNQRYEEYRSGATFENIDVYIDELPAIARALGAKFLTPILQQLLTEARKVGIRLWLLSQGEQVKMLGLEGMSDIREGISFIRLGRLAKKYARRLKNKRLQAVVEGMSRPCLVDDSPAKVPGKSEITAVIKVREREGLRELPASAQTQTLPTAEQTQEDDTLVMQLPDGDEIWTYDDLYAKVDKFLAAREFHQLPKLVKGSRYDRGLMCWIGSQMITKHGKSKTNVIKEGWGLKGSEGFKRGSTIFDHIGFDGELQERAEANERNTANFGVEL